MKNALAFGLAAAVAVSSAAPQPGHAAASAEQQPASAVQAAAETATEQVPQIQSPVYWVQDLQSGRVLSERDGTREIEPASFTKLMTAYLVFKALDEGRLKTEQKVTPSENAWRAEGTRMFLRRNAPVKVGELLKGLGVLAANDAALALAEAVAGSEAAFVQQMNAEAARLEMKQTHFANATGKPEDGQKTSAADLAKLVAAMQHYATYLPMFAEKSFTYQGIEQPNDNLLLYRDGDVDGLMTAQGSDGGWHLLATSKRNGRKVLALIVGADSEEMRTAESSRLLNWALQAFDTVAAYAPGKALSKVKVYKGQSGEVEVGALDGVYLTLPHGGSSNIRPVLETEQPVLAPVQKGQVLGRLKIMQDDKVLFEQDIVALQAVEPAGWFGSLTDGLLLWFKSLFS